MKAPIALLSAAALCAGSAPFARACEVTSGAATAALVELYTSEGCSSCPPADRQLSRLRSQLDPGAAIVPLALHVTYWDQIGWKDGFAQKLFDARQRELVERSRKNVVYTPQYFVNGTELRDWSAALPATIRRINAQAAPLTITLGTSQRKSTLTLDANVAAADPATAGALYLAVSESGLSTQVLRGENGGATLHHDDTVRAWLGPFPLEKGKLRVQRQLDIPAGWRSERLHAVAFVQAASDGRVLQAVSSAECTAAVR